ncbi:MAG: hypothetical protein MI861_07175 [Pirellulales bacterium]|nr:hypothetical protein [Pirellulales bacterium]
MLAYTFSDTIQIQTRRNSMPNFFQNLIGGNRNNGQNNQNDLANPNDPSKDPSQPDTITYSGDGYFEYKGKKFNLMDMCFLVQETYRDGLSTVLTDQFNEVNELGKKMQALTELLQVARNAKPNKDASHDDDAGAFKLAGSDEPAKTFKGWCAYYGIPESDVDYREEKKKKHSGSSRSTWEQKWQGNIDNINNELQTVQTQSQSKMMKYKQTLGYFNNSISETNFTLTEFKRSFQTIWS